jgi:hypothetical protein
MVSLLMMMLLLQGPKDLQIGEDAKVKPPLVVPVGTTIPVSLVNKISTKDAKDGDGIYAKTVFPITVNNEVVIPVGSHLRGKITRVQRPGRVKGRGELTISFQTLIMPSGLTIPLYASLAGASGAGERKGESSIQGESSKDTDAVAVGTAAGGGAIGGALGRGADGAAVGGASGAAVGLATVLLTRGSDLVLEPGTTLEIVLDRALEP